MSNQWEFCIQREVLANRETGFPQEIREIVEYDHPAHGPTVSWNYERHSNLIVVSQRPLSASNYVFVDRTKVYEVESGEPGHGQIRPPAGMSEEIVSYFRRGTPLFYLAYTDMVQSDNPSVYLIPESKLLQLLPQEREQRIEPGDFEHSLFQMPAFLPRP